MINYPKFSYVEIGAKNYKVLSKFYQEALNFKESADETWLNGKDGIVLSCPGYKNNDILFGFVSANKGANSNINDVGYAHICFETSDMEATLSRFLRLGGKVLSFFDKPLHKPCVYTKDIEGNIVEFHIPFMDGIGFKAVGKTLKSLLGFSKDKSIRKNDISLPSSLKFIHVNLISLDYSQLINFYTSTIGAKIFGPFKDHSGKFKSNVIGIENVHVMGQHILLPHYEINYPTLEIFTYSTKGRLYPQEIGSLGINLIGFKDENPSLLAEQFVKFGGKIIETNKDYILVSDIDNNMLIIR